MKVYVFDFEAQYRVVDSEIEPGETPEDTMRRHLAPAGVVDIEIVEAYEAD